MTQSPRHHHAAIALLAVMSLLLAGLASAAGASTATKDTPAPDGLPAFYSVPQPLKGKPGALLKSEKVKAPGMHGTVYRVMYLSSTLTGDKPVAVTGTVVVPDGTAPKGGFPVVTWAHGTNGMADLCAPSLDPAKNNYIVPIWYVNWTIGYQPKVTLALPPLPDGGGKPLFVYGRIPVLGLHKS